MNLRYEPPTVRTTGRHRLDRGPIGGSGADRDNPMTTYDHICLTGADAGQRMLTAMRLATQFQKKRMENLTIHPIIRD
jgi:hypothetical protein